MKLSRLISNLAADLNDNGDQELTLPRGQRITDGNAEDGVLKIYAQFEPKSYDLLEWPDREVRDVS